MEDDEDFELPWYRKLEEPPPLKLLRRISSNKPGNGAPNNRTLATFPWDESSLKTLWQGDMNTPENAQKWSIMVTRYWDAVAVGADLQVYVHFVHSKRESLAIELPDFSQKLIAADKTNVAWALWPRPDVIEQPLLVITRGSMMWIYNLEQKGISLNSRGHGGAITSIAVHPLAPHFIATTSRDHSTRIYNLLLSPIKEPNNPHWPPMPKGKQSRAGPAHGLHANVHEGSGRGRCIIVLVGGRSGGHDAAVLGAAFHPTFPVIATCGMDRAVKIWLARTNTDGVQLVREDKPLFSSPRIHKSRVTAVSWVTDELLVSHSAPAIMFENVDGSVGIDTYLEPSQLVVWRWLSLDRFFPAQHYNHQRQATLRGCQSDYLDSSSFKIVASYSYPEVPTQYITPSPSLFQSAYHDPVVLWTVPGHNGFHVTNLALLKPRKMPSSEEGIVQARINEEEGTTDLAAVAEQLHIDQEDKGTPRPSADSAVPERDDEEEEEEEEEVRTIRLEFAPFESSPLSDVSWRVPLPPSDKGTINCVAMAFGGRLIVGAGTKGSVWVWEVCS